MKLIYLKKGTGKQTLAKYGFETHDEGKTYVLPLKKCNKIVCYMDTKQLVFKYPKKVRPRKVLKYLPDGLKTRVEVRDGIN